MWRVSVEISLWQDGRESVVPQFSWKDASAREAWYRVNELRAAMPVRVEVPAGMERSDGVFESEALSFVTDEASLYNRLTVETRIRVEVL
jgi:hypothetical protein